MNHHAKRWLWNGVRLAVVLGIFVYLYHTGQLNPSKLATAFRHPGPVIAVAALFMVGFVITVQRWRLLLQIQALDVPFRPALHLSCIGFFFSMLLPGAVTGDIVKGYYLVRGQDQKTALAGTILADRLIGLYTVFAVATLAVLFCFVRDGLSWTQGVWALPSVRILAGFIVAVGLGMTLGVTLVLLAGAKAREWIRQGRGRWPLPGWATAVAEGMASYASRPALTLKAILLSVTAQIPAYMGLGWTAHLLGARGLAAADYLFILPVCVTINSIPVAPGGWGVGEAGFRSVFLLYGSDVGAEVAFIFHVILLVLAVGVGGTAYLCWNGGPVK